MKLVRIFALISAAAGKRTRKPSVDFQAQMDETLPGQRKDVFIHVAPLKITRHENLKLCKRRLVKAKVG